MNTEDTMKAIFGDSYEPADEEIPLGEIHEFGLEGALSVLLNSALKDIANPIPTDSWLPGSFTKRQAD